MKFKALPLIISVCAAMMLTVLPMPHWLAPFRPPWVLLMIMFWLSIGIENIGIVFIWSCGLLLDLITVSTLGEHSLAMLVSCFLLQNYALRFKFYPLWQQDVLIGVFVLLYQIILCMIELLLGNYHGLWLFWAPALSSMIFWPWITLLMRTYSRRNTVHGH